MQASKIVQPWTHLLFSLLLLLWIFLLLLRSFLSSESSIHHLQSRISRSQTNKLRSESLDFSLPLMKPRRISFTKKYLKPNSLQSQRQLTSFSGPPICDAGDGSSLKLPHLMALRHYKSNSFAGNVMGIAASLLPLAAKP